MSKSHQLGNMINRLTLGRLKYGWWTSDHQSDAHPIFIGGCDRSGTTLLRLILNAHSRIMLGPETAILLGNRNLDHLQRVTGLRHELLRNLYRRSSCIGQFAEAVLGLLAEQQNKDYWGEKTPHNVWHIDRLFGFFPHAWFIHIIRDGRDVVCSLRNHPKREWRQGGMVETGIVNPWATCVNWWVEAVRAGMRWRGHDRYLQLQYEQLVENPRGALEPLLGRIGLQWEEPMTEDFRLADTAGHVNHPGLARPIYRSATNRWVRDLPADARALFQGDPAELLRELGYAVDDTWIASTDEPVAA
jgi:hypothetical protein